MNKDSVLFSLVGIGFGLFFGFLFASWANQRATAPAPRAAGEAGQAQSNAAANPEQLRAAAEGAAKRARENQNDFGAQMDAAETAYRAERFDDSLGFLLRANELQPDNLNPVVALGHVNADAGNYKAAEKWFTAALAKSPDDADVRADLGRVLLLQNPPEYDRAIAEFQRALKVDGRHEPSLQFLSFAYAQKGNVAEARSTLARLEQANPNNQVIPRLREEIEAAAKPSPRAAGDGR
ncbi:MAG TPA: tetratricopeptide repeat protein [Pyrinomonadaceae bacterium]|nr:tetratricopeptide repeat protein [Pyrinomonadaceae bacterium]